MNIHSFSLNLEQKFQMKLVEDYVAKIDRERMSSLLIDLAKVLMIKDNAIRDVMQNETLAIAKI